MALRFLAACWLLIASALAAADQVSAGLVPLPRLAARVTDLTGTLPPDRKAALEAAAAAIEREKGAQVAILMLPTTQPEAIEQFGIRLAEAWKIGRGKTDDGIIVIVAKDDRKMRIEVGYGLEGAIPDAVARRIEGDLMAPRFKEDDFAGGLDEAVAALGKIIGGEALPAPSGNQPGQDQLPMGYWILAVILGSGVLRALLGLTGSLLASGLAAGLTWWIFGSLPLAAIAAVAAFVLSFSRPGGGGRLGGGGFSSSSSGGGGFSGGGGSFGGGGASGSW
jgi:uncharacterized protein